MKKLLVTTFLICILFLPTITSVNAVTSLLIKVVDIYGEPVKGIYITLVSPPPGSYVIARGYSNEEGFLSIEMNNPPDEVTIFVAWKGVVVHKSRISPYSGSVTIECQIGDISLSVLAKSGNPIQNSRVSLSWMTTAGITTVEGYTNKKGNVVFKHLPLVKMNLTIYYRNRLLYSAEVNSKTIALSGLTIYLELYRLRIKVLDGDNNPINNAQVMLYLNGDRVSQYSNSEGIVEFDNLFPGNYSVLISYLGYEKNLKINLEQDLTKRVVFENLRSYILKIIVVDSEGNYLSSCRVEIEEFHGRFYLAGYTDENGVYSANLPTGLYQITVYYKHVTRSKIVSMDSNNVIRFILKSEPESIIGKGGGINVYSLPSYIFLVILIMIILGLFVLYFHFCLSKKII